MLWTPILFMAATLWLLTLSACKALHAETLQANSITIGAAPTFTAVPILTSTPLAVVTMPRPVASATFEATAIEPAPIVGAGSESAPTEPVPTRPNDPVLVGAGDIAVCNGDGDEETARLLDQIPGLVFTLGDNAYPRGSAAEFANCYEPSWGRHKARTRPVPGNHDYATPGARGYYKYFGARAGNPKRGYYSYDLGAWHIIVLNSEIDTSAASKQVAWLRADLEAHPTRCTLAMWHKPLFSSGPHGDDGSGTKTYTLWEVLYAAGADVILNGHDHTYERFAPQDPRGRADPARGIREFVVGTGGAPPYPFQNIKPNSEARQTGHFGVLKLTLHADSYDWEFIPVTGALFQDRGSDRCH